MESAHLLVFQGRQSIWSNQRSFLRQFFRVTRVAMLGWWLEFVSIGNYVPRPIREVLEHRKEERLVMVLAELKLGTLALKTLSKPIAARLKKEAGLHPKFRNFIISLAQVVWVNLDSEYVLALAWEFVFLLVPIDSHIVLRMILLKIC